MQSFVDWMDDPEHGFYVREVWDDEKGEWIGPGKMRLRDFQRRVFAHCLTPNPETGRLPYETILYSTIKKSGKALALDTPIPTPSGWTTMGEIKVGDELYGKDGSVIKVTFVTEVMYDRPCYKMTFSSGDVIIADADHQWVVYMWDYVFEEWSPTVTLLTSEMQGNFLLENPAHPYTYRLPQVEKVGSNEVIYIESIEPVESVPVKCITVDAWDELYLVGHGFIPTHNTALAAAIEAWYAEQLPPDSYLYCIAGDEEQAGLVFGDITYHAKELGYKTLKNKIEFPNGTTINVLSQSYKTIAGTRHALTVWDELWNYTTEASRRAWDELTPIPTVPNSLRVVATYAGYENESDLLWDLYLQGVGVDEHEKGQGEIIPELEDLPCWSNGRLFTYWDHEARMPWQTDEYYEEQRKSLRPTAYLRLHTNSWTSSSEEFIPIEWWDRACKVYERPADQDPNHPYRHADVTISVDAATKRDCTAISGWAHDSHLGKTVMLFHKIWTPEKGVDFDLEATVEAYILEKKRSFNIVSVIYDPRDLHQTMTRLRSMGLPCHELIQNQENMVRASQAFYDALKYDNVWAYPDEEWRKHIQMAIAENAGRGFRIVKDKGNRKAHVDGAISSAMGVYDAIQRSEIYTGDEIKVFSPFRDTSVWNTEPEGPKLPWMFNE